MGINFDGMRMMLDDGYQISLSYKNGKFVCFAIKDMVAAYQFPRTSLNKIDSELEYIACSGSCGCRDEGTVDINKMNACEKFLYEGGSLALKQQCIDEKDRYCFEVYTGKSKSLADLHTPALVGNCSSVKGVFCAVTQFVEENREDSLGGSV